MIVMYNGISSRPQAWSKQKQKLKVKLDNFKSMSGKIFINNAGAINNILQRCPYLSSHLDYKAQQFAMKKEIDKVE